MQSWIRSGWVAAALLVATVQAFACFGDNATDNEEEGPVDGKPEIVEITAPAELDSGTEADLVVKLKGGANEQLSVAVDTSLGAFTPQSKVVITDDNGDATFTSRYASGAVGGEATFTVNVSTLANTRASAAHKLTVFEVERQGNVAAIAHVEAEQANYLIAYPFTLTANRTVTKLAIIAPAPATTLVGLYTSSTSTGVVKPADALVRMTATLVEGANEIAIAPLSLAAGTYWMAVSYMGTPMVRKSIEVGDSVSGWRITGHLFTSGLPSSLDAATSSSLSLRNFYLVLRK